MYVYLKGNLIKLSCELLSSNVYILILSWGPLCQQFRSQLRYWSVVCTDANFIYGLSKLSIRFTLMLCNICRLYFTLFNFLENFLINIWVQECWHNTSEVSYSYLFKNFFQFWCSYFQTNNFSSFIFISLTQIFKILLLYAMEILSFCRTFTT